MLTVSFLCANELAHTTGGRNRRREIEVSMLVIWDETRHSNYVKEG